MDTIRSTTPRAVMALVLLSAAVLSAGAARADAYIGFGTGRANLDDRLFGASTDFKADATSEHYFFGFSLGRKTRFEFGRADLGLLEDTITIGGIPTPTAVKVDGMTYSFVFSEPLAEDFSIYLRAGVFSWDREVTGPLPKPRGSGDNGLFGIGASLRLSDDLSLRAEYERFEVGQGNVDTPVLSLVYHF